MRDAEPREAAPAGGRACRGRRRGSRWSRRSTCASSSSGIAARCSGFEPPPSRNEPALATASMTRFGPDRPGDAPARVAPVLGEAVEEHDRIAVDVLDVARGALDRQLRPAAPRPDVVRVELVDEQRAVELARDRDPARELVAADQLAGRVARVRQQQRRQAAAVDLAAQIVDGEGVAALALEQDRDGGERLEDVEQLLVGGVVGQEVAEVDVAEAGGRARERGAPAAGDADVLGACTATACPGGRAGCRGRRSPRAAPRCRRPARTPGRRRRS